MSENKTAPTGASVEEFINAVEHAGRREDARAALALYREVTGLEPVMWGPSIIGFGSRHFRYDSGREGDMPAAAFSPRKSNLVFYLGDSFDGAEDLYARLGKHRRSVACVYANRLADLDLEVLREIIRRDAESPASGCG